MIRKLLISFDFDNTTTNSTKAFIDVYKTIHHHEIESGLIPFPMWEGVKRYSFKDELPLLDRSELLSIFNSKAFFDNLSFIRDSNLYSMGDLIAEFSLSNKYEVSICTVGSSVNLALKEKYIAYKIPEFDMNNFIGIENSKCAMDKSILKEKGVAVHIDDHQDALMSCGVKYPILFCLNDVKTDWNDKIYDDIRFNKCTTVSQLRDKILDIYYFEDAIG